MRALVRDPPRFPPLARHVGTTAGPRVHAPLSHSAACPSCPRSRSPRAGSTRRCAVPTIESALAPGINALKTFDPPLDALDGRGGHRRAPPRQAPRRRRRRRPVAARAPDVRRAPAAVRQARRRRATAPRGCSCASTDGRELRLREFGTRQAAWVKLLRDRRGRGGRRRSRRLGPGGVAGPAAACARCSRPGRAPAARGAARPARDRRHRPLVGRRDPVDRDALAVQARATTSTTRRPPRCARRWSSASTAAIEHYERVVTLPIPDKLPMPLEVHRHAGRAVPALRHDDRGGPLRGLRHVLLPGRPDRRARAQGPPAVAAAEVAPGQRSLSRWAICASG